MSEQNKSGVKKQAVGRVLLAVLSFIISVCVAVSAIFVIERYIKKDGKPDTSVESSPSSIIEVTPEPEAITKVSTASVNVTGDLLMHLPIISAAAQSNGEYDFNNIFTLFQSYVSAADYSVANLETTLRSETDGYKYSGYPSFNCPDDIVSAAKSAGFDMLLTANNHSYDTRLKGMLRTLEVIDKEGLDRLGTHKSAEEKRYAVKEINDIKLGMMCYTYETDPSINGVALNGISMTSEAKVLVNAFSYSETDAFYKSVEENMAAMKSGGAEAYVLFIHWGEEYNLKPNTAQKEIAQKMCDLGIDIIVGGHPHVVEPVELLQSTLDPNRKTVCIYSVGNAVSNQRKERMNLKTGHTEDGILFGFTFAKYSNGEVLLENVELLPTWVNLHASKETGKKVYQILPLDEGIEDWKTAFSLSDATEKAARASAERTKAITGEGMEAVKAYLSTLEYPM